MSGASDEPSAEVGSKRSRRRGRVSFGSDVFADETSLSSLPAAISSSLRRIPLSDLAYNPKNPRYGYEDPRTLELAASFREHGQLQHATAVSRDVFLAHYPDVSDLLGSASWVVVIGNRRLAAAHLAEFSHLLTSVEDRLGGADPMLTEATLVENIHREDLPPLLEARELQGLVERHGSQVKVAQRLAKTQGWVSQRLSLLKLVPEVQEQLRSGEITVKEARTVASAAPEHQLDRLSEIRGAPHPSTESTAPASRGTGESRTSSVGRRQGQSEDPDVDRIARRLRKQLDDSKLDQLIEALSAMKTGEGITR